MPELTPEQQRAIDYSRAVSDRAWETEPGPQPMQPPRSAQSELKTEILRDQFWKLLDFAYQGDTAATFSPFGMVYHLRAINILLMNTDAQIALWDWALEWARHKELALHREQVRQMVEAQNKAVLASLVCQNCGQPVQPSLMAGFKTWWCKRCGQTEAVKKQ